ncbi:hypothetical protein EfmJHP36_31800 (plasmid) [Enterococcus faecium]|nr:hypothetical protein EfmJHP36_31800 [Enterococcus faecium]
MYKSHLKRRTKENVKKESIVPDTSITSIRQLTAYDLNLYKSHLKRRTKENVKIETTKTKLKDNNNLGLFK